MLNQILDSDILWRLLKNKKTALFGGSFITITIQKN